MGVSSLLSVSSNKTKHTETSIQDIGGVSSINTIVYRVTVHLRLSIKAVFMFSGLDFFSVMHSHCAPLLTERFFIRLPPRQWATEWRLSCNPTKMGRPATVLPDKSILHTNAAPEEVRCVWIYYKQQLATAKLHTKDYKLKKIVKHLLLSKKHVENYCDVNIV